MAIRSTKGLKIYLEDGSTTPVTVTATAITNAKPASVTVSASDFAKVADGDLIAIAGSGMASLDGKTFIVGNAATNSFDLLGSDATADAAVTAGNLTVYKAATDLTQLCVSNISIDNNPPGTINVGDFCNPDRSIPDTSVDLGNVTLGSYHDVTNTGFQLLEKAAADGNARKLLIVLPGGGGDVAIEGTVSSFALTDIPLSGAVSWQATLAMASAPRLLY